MQELLKAVAHFQLPDIVTITQTITDTQRKNALRQLSEMDPYNISSPRGIRALSYPSWRELVARAYYK